MRELEETYTFINNHCENLYVKLFEFHFRGAHKNDVLEELVKYQNSDGGFGNGLEPDYTLPDSSAIATTIAFEILDELQVTEHPMIDRALKYLEESYDEKEFRWWSVPAEVNDYPHAPWWHYDPDKKQTEIDENWGNPTAQIIGILYRHKDQIKKINLVDLIEVSIRHLNKIEKWESFHEIYCYIKMFKDLPGHYRELLDNKLREAITALICLDRTKWTEYVAKPLDFIPSPNHPLFSVIQPYVEENLNFLQESYKNGLWLPTWEWGQYPEEWENAKDNWIAKLTILNLRILHDFDINV